MLRKRLFCIISISLCALFSSRAQDWEEMAVAYEREVYDGAGLVEMNAALLANPMNCSLPGFSVHGIFQARVLEWGSIAFSAFSLS